MKRNTIIEIVIGVIVVGALVWFYASRSPAPSGGGPSPLPGAKQGPQKILTPEEKAKLMQEVINTQNDSLCSQFSVADEQNRCHVEVLMAKASVNRNASFCNGVNYLNFNVICKDNVIISKTIDSKDPKQCDALIDKTRSSECLSYAKP